MKNLTFIICSNGFGHYKRVNKVYKEIINKNLPIQINFICNKEKLEGFCRTFKTSFHDVNIHYELMKKEPNWIDPYKLSFKNYLSWFSRFKNNRIILDSDLIVSDNYLAPLSSGIKCILMGSFLWHEVIKSYNEETRSIYENENKLIMDVKPKMIGLEYMAMNYIQTLTEFKKTNWFCEKKNNLDYNFKNNVLLTSGGTEHLDLVLLEIVRKLSKLDKSKNFYLDSKLYKKLNKKIENVFEFDFQESSFKMIDAIVCRPGIGILTDCISYNIPPIAIFNNSNIEIFKNAQKVHDKKLGFIFDVSNGLNNEIIKLVFNAMNSIENINKFKKNISKEKLNGHKIAADIIINELVQ